MPLMPTSPGIVDTFTKPDIIALQAGVTADQLHLGDPARPARLIPLREMCRHSGDVGINGIRCDSTTRPQPDRDPSDAYTAGVGDGYYEFDGYAGTYRIVEDDRRCSGNPRCQRYPGWDRRRADARHTQPGRSGYDVISDITAQFRRMGSCIASSNSA